MVFERFIDLARSYRTASALQRDELQKGFCSIWSGLARPEKAYVFAMEYGKDEPAGDFEKLLDEVQRVRHVMTREAAEWILKRYSPSGAEEKYLRALRDYASLDDYA